MGKASNAQVLERIVAMVSGLGATIINNVEIPPAPAERQIMLRVKFAEVDRQAQNEFGAAILSTGGLNTLGQINTQQFGSPRLSSLDGSIPATLAGQTFTFQLQDILSVFAFRPDLNLGAAIKALHTKNLIQILAEPNVITTDGKEAHFLVGGEFPVPVVQGGSSAGSVTIQFREFGIRFDFLPKITERGSIKMQVNPEVSALDFANAVQIQGFSVPALSTRRVETEVELMPGQSFMVGGLLDNRIGDTFNRIPGLSSIPLLGRIFKSYQREKQSSELMVFVTPEFPEVIDVGEALSSVPMPVEFMEPLADYVERLKAEKANQ